MITQIRSCKTKIIEIELKQGIHRHQTPTWSHNAASGYRLMVSHPPIVIRPIMAKSDVIYITGST